MARCSAGALCVLCVTLTDCRRASEKAPAVAATQPAQNDVTPAPKQHDTVPASGYGDDCGLADYPVSRSTRDLIADAARDHSKRGRLQAKALIDPEGKITHLRVTSVYAPDTPDTFKINAPAIERIKQWRYKPTMPDGKPVSVCSMIDVNIDFTR
jgi:hypothetical protein